MPTANERIENKGLTGRELRQILINELTRLLDRDAMFSDRLLYEKVAFKLRYELLLENPTYPKHMNQSISTPMARNEKPNEKNGQGNITSPDKISPGKHVKVGKELEKTIDSPNLARIDNGLPLKVQHKDLETGRMVEREVPFEGEGSGKDHPDLNVSSERDTSGEEWK